MNGIYRMDIKRGLSSPGFYVGIVLCSLAAVFGMGEMLENIAESMMPEGEIRFLSAVCIALRTEAIAYVLPIACTFAVSGMFIEDMQSRVLYYSILRTTKKRYYTSKILSCVLVGFLTVLATILLLLIIFGILFPPKQAEIQTFQTDSLIYLCKMAAILCINSSFYALLGGVISVGSNNRYMAYASPFILYYVISTLLKAYLSDYPILNPEEWMLLRISSEGQVMVILLAANLIAGTGYLIMMERRWKHE